MSAIIYWRIHCKLPRSFRCIKAYMLAFSGRFSRKCLEGISFNFFVCFIFNWSIGSAPKKKKHQYLTLYQNWNRTQVYFELVVSASYTIWLDLVLRNAWTVYDKWTKAKSGAFIRQQKVLKLVKVYWTILSMLQNQAARNCELVSIMISLLSTLGFLAAWFYHYV